MLRAEEEPEEPETEPSPASAAIPTMIVAPVGSAGVEFEYRTEVLTAEQVLDGATLPDKLAKESAGGWDLVDVLQARDKYVVLFRKAKKADRGERRVGFFAQ